MNQHTSLLSANRGGVAKKTHRRLLVAYDYRYVLYVLATIIHFTHVSGGRSTIYYPRAKLKALSLFTTIFHA